MTIRAYLPYTLVGPPVRGLAHDPLAVYSSRTDYNEATQLGTLLTLSSARGLTLFCLCASGADLRVGLLVEPVDPVVGSTGFSVKGASSRFSSSSSCEEKMLIFTVLPEISVFKLLRF